jgi:hypothetical protein
MAILGVLLGITMSSVAVCIWFMRREYRYLRDLNHACELERDRVDALERRKSHAQAVQGTPPVQDATKTTARTMSWSQIREVAESGEIN